jgi:hypothetical protein
MAGFVTNSKCKQTSFRYVFFYSHKCPTFFKDHFSKSFDLNKTQKLTESKKKADYFCSSSAELSVTSAWEFDCRRRRPCWAVSRQPAETAGLPLTLAQPSGQFHIPLIITQRAPPYEC